MASPIILTGRPRPGLALGGAPPLCLPVLATIVGPCDHTVHGAGRLDGGREVVVRGNSGGSLTVQPGSLNDLSVVFSATISGHESCHINEGPHGFDSCNLQTSLEGGREDFNAQWSMKVSAVVPVTSSDDLAHPGAGTGSGRETSVAISSKGTIVDGHNALDGCSYVSPSATEVQATASPAPTPAQVTDLHALRSGSTVKDFSLTLLPGGQDSVDTTVDFDENDCWPGGPFSETLISEFAGDSFIGAADPVAHDDHGNPVYTGWRLDPDGTWQKDGTGPSRRRPWTPPSTRTSLRGITPPGRSTSSSPRNAVRDPARAHPRVGGRRRPT